MAYYEAKDEASDYFYKPDNNNNVNDDYYYYDDNPNDVNYYDGYNAYVNEYDTNKYYDNYGYDIHYDEFKDNDEYYANYYDNDEYFEHHDHDHGHDHDGFEEDELFDENEFEYNDGYMHEEDDNDDNDYYYDDYNDFDNELEFGFDDMYDMYDDYDMYDYEFDEEFGDCFRAYAVFQCNNCQVTWTSDDVWYYFNKKDQKRFLAHLCPKCNQERFPRDDEELEDYYDYVMNRNEINRLIEINAPLIGTIWLVRRFGFYECDCGDCQHEWVSSWTWVIRYTDQAYFMQDCRECKETKCPNRKHKNRRLRKKREQHGVYAHGVQPLLRRQSNGRRKGMAVDESHDKLGCHYCRDKPLSCPEMFANVKDPQISIRKGRQ